MLAAEPESLPGGTGFDCMKAAGYRGVMKSSWDGHFERLLVKRKYSTNYSENPGLKGSQRWAALAPCGRIGVHEDNPGEVVYSGGDTRTMVQSLKRAVALEWSQPGSVRQITWVTNDGAQEMQLPKLVSVQKIVSESLIQDIELRI